MELEEFLAAEKKDLVTLQNQFSDEAREALSETLTLIEVARENGITISEQEVEAEIKRRAEAENVKLSQMRRLLNDTGEINSIRNQIFYQKVSDLIRSKAEVTEVEA